MSSLTWGAEASTSMLVGTSRSELVVSRIFELYRKYDQELRALGYRLRDVFHAMERRGYGTGFGDVEGECLYMLIREQRPQLVFEISPNAGWSTNYILAALTANQTGELHSFELIKRFRDRPTERVIRSNQHKDWDQNRLHIYIGDARANIEKVQGTVDVLMLDSCHEAWFAEWYVVNLFPRVRGLVFTQDVVFVDELEHSTEAAFMWRWLQDQQICPMMIGLIQVQAELEGHPTLRSGYPERIRLRSNAIAFQFPPLSRGSVPTLRLSPMQLVEEAERYVLDRPREADRLLSQAIQSVLRDQTRANRHRLLCRAGACYSKLGEWSEAKRTFRRAVGVVMQTGGGGERAKGFTELIIYFVKFRRWLLAMQTGALVLCEPRLWRRVVTGFTSRLRARIRGR